MEKMFTSVIQPLNFGGYGEGGFAFLSGAPHVDLSRAWFVDHPDDGWICRGNVRALHLALVSGVYFSDVEEGCIRPRTLANH